MVKEKVGVRIKYNKRLTKKVRAKHPKVVKPKAKAKAKAHATAKATKKHSTRAEKKVRKYILYILSISYCVQMGGTSEARNGHVSVCLMINELDQGKGRNISIQIYCKT